MEEILKSMKFARVSLIVLIIVAIVVSILTFGWMCLAALKRELDGIIYVLWCLYSIHQVRSLSKILSKYKKDIIRYKAYIKELNSISDELERLTKEHEFLLREVRSK